MNDQHNKDLINESNNAWKELAAWWDNNIGDGDPFHQYLIFPHILKYVNCKPNQRILDIACGNGALTRRLAKHGAKVHGIDISDTFIQQAKTKSTKNIQYDVLDATSEQDLEIITTDKFNSIVCSMALHDLPTIKPIVNSIPKLLHRDGCFIFSIPHPCFNMGDVKLDFTSKTPHIERSRYIHPEHIKMKSKPNQPIDQHCFHRSITEIFQHFFSIDMVLDAIVEPALCDIHENLDKIKLDWKYLPEIPPAMICRWIYNT